MKLADIIRAVQSELPITMRHEKWLMRNPNPVYSDDALQFAQKALAGEFQFRPRMLFRSSGIGTCQRRRIYAALGIAEVPILDAKLSNIFHTGNFLHLKWQMAGLSEGWLQRAEIAIDNEALRFGGTLDGILHDGSGFEFKSINSYGHSTVLQNPKPLHIRQIHAYMYLMPEIDQFSVIYENKDTGEWRELRITKDPAVIRSIDREVGALNESFDSRKLPPVLDDCKARQGNIYRNCPYKDICLGMKKWPTVLSGKAL